MSGGTNSTSICTGETFGVGVLDVGRDARELGLGVGEELAARGELGVADAEAVAVVLDDDDGLCKVLQIRVRVCDALQQLLSGRDVLGAVWTLRKKLLPPRVCFSNSSHTLFNLSVTMSMMQ